MLSFPESTCVDCGERIPAGMMKHCKLTGECCSWRKPDSLARHYRQMEGLLYEISALLCIVAILSGLACLYAFFSAQYGIAFFDLLVAFITFVGYDCTRRESE